MALFGGGRFDPYGFSMNPNFLPSGMPQLNPASGSAANGGIGGNLGVDTSVPQDPYQGQRPQGGGGLLPMMLSNGQGLGVPPQPMPDPANQPTIRPSVLADQPMQLAPIDTAQLIQRIKAKGPGFFDKDGLGTKIGSVIGDLAVFGPAAPFVMAQRGRAERDRQRENQQWLDRHNIERGEKLSDRTSDENKPQYFSGSEDRVKFDPVTGKASTIFDAPTSAEAYARNFGAPGTDEYRTAMQDYTLRGWGDTALNAKTTLEGLRQSGRVNLRGVPTYANLHPRPTGGAGGGVTPTKVIGPILAKISRGEQLTPGEQAALDRIRPPKTVNPITALIANMGGGGAPSAPVPAPRPAPPPAANSRRGPVRVKTVEEARALPPGTPFITPDGRQKVR